MRLARFSETQLGLLTDNGIIGLTNRLGIDTEDPLVKHITGDYDASEYTDANPDYDRSEVELNSPVKRLRKIIAVPLNYEKHIKEAITDKDITTDEWFSIKDKGSSLKSPVKCRWSIHSIELSFDDRRVDHKVELTFVMEEDRKDVNTVET